MTLLDAFDLYDSEGQSTFQNEITLRLGRQDLHLVNISCKFIRNFLHEVGHRQNDRQTDLIT